MNSRASSPAARGLIAGSPAARPPGGMLGIGLIVRTQGLTGSIAGLVTGAYASEGALCRSVS